MSVREHVHCPDCGASLEGDGICMACLFEEALGSGAAREESGFPQSGFGKFAPHEAGDFGKFTLRRKLGTGGMGVIWEAGESALKRVVALKMIRGFAFSTESEKMRFRAEASAVAQLDHPNIVPIYEVGELEDQPFFTMKLLEGAAFRNDWKKAPCLSVRRSALWRSSRWRCSTLTNAVFFIGI